MIRAIAGSGAEKIRPIRAYLPVVGSRVSKRYRWVQQRV